MATVPISLMTRCEFPQRSVLYYDFQLTSSRNSKCVLLRIHGVRASTIPEMANERRILEMLNRHSEASSHILMPLETFWIDGSTDRHLCWVLELIGPDFQFMADVCGPEDDLYPAAMVWQLAKQALESLSFLHAKGVCHGC